VQKFAKQHQWQLVHQWLGAGLEQKLGLSAQQWNTLMGTLSLPQQQLLQLKLARHSDQAIAKTLKCTPKQLQKRWTELLDTAWAIRNGNTEVQAG